MSFTFKQFQINDSRCAMKVGTDGVLLGAWADVAQARRILDIGCGSGLIALMAAQRNLHAEVTGIEIDTEAVLDAQANAAASPFADRVKILQGDAVRHPFPDASFHCILSNPPYHEEELLPPTDARAKARHTAGGGLTFAALLRTAHRLLDKSFPYSNLSLILPATAVRHFVSLANVHGFVLTHRTDVVTRPGKPAKRVLLELILLSTTRTQQKISLKHDELILTGDNGKRSEAYATLCREFYL